MVSGTNQTHPWDKRDLSLGIIDTVPSQTGRLLLNCTGTCSVCSVCPWDGWGSSLGQVSCERCWKIVYVFLSIFILLPMRSIRTPPCLWFDKRDAPFLLGICPAVSRLSYVVVSRVPLIDWAHESEWCRQHTSPYKGTNSSCQAVEGSRHKER